MDKFELLCLLEAISNYAYDIHYTAKGKNFYADHLFSERLADVDVKDDFIETLYLGESEDAPESADIARKVAELTPKVSENTQDNFKKLREMIVSALVGIENYKGTKGEEDLLGSVAHILQRHNGLLYRDLTYTPSELRNDNEDWQDIVAPEDTAQTLENGGQGSGNFGHAGRLGKVGGSAPKGQQKELTESSKSGSLKLERRTYPDYNGKDVEFETTKGNWAILDKAAAKELEITPDVESAIKNTGAEPFGLKFRKKLPTKAVGKIQRVRKEKPSLANKTDTYILAHVWDNVRYSQVSSPEKLKSDMYSTLSELQNKGHKIKEIKNYFDNDKNPYDGINVKMIAPNGQRYELQFNTKKNFDIKEEQLHPIYDKDREEEDKTKHEEYQAQMFKIAEQFDFPEGIRAVSKKEYKQYLKGGKNDKDTEDRAG